jgi:hypothetical protein
LKISSSFCCFKTGISKKKKKIMKEKLEVTETDLRQLFHKSALATAKLKYALMGIGNPSQTHDPPNGMIQTAKSIVI